MLEAFWTTGVGNNVCTLLVTQTSLIFFLIELYMKTLECCRLPLFSGALFEQRISKGVSESACLCTILLKRRGPFTHRQTLLRFSPQKNYSTDSWQTSFDLLSFKQSHTTAKHLFQNKPLKGVPQVYGTAFMLISNLSKHFLIES